jgi:NADH:ubiquinone oxidoreductase subunit 3 (subunit A)
VKTFTIKGETWLIGTPILIMLIIAVGFALVSLGVSYLLSPKNPTAEKLAPYECGIFLKKNPPKGFQ